MCFGKPKIKVEAPPVVAPQPPVEIGKVSEELDAERNPQEFKKKFGKRRFLINLGGTDQSSGSGLKV